MKRIAISQLLQETNSLNPVQTERADFEVYGLAQGSEIVDRYGDVGELAGFTTFPEIAGEEVEWVGLLRAVAWSGGPLRAGLLREFCAAMVEPLRETQVDGVLLSLHGAQAAVDEPDASGRMLEAIRQAVGDRVPIAATLDLHANITPLMVNCADVLVGYHTFPHVDHVSCGKRAAHALARMLQSGERPAVSAWKIPMVVSSEGRATDQGIQRELWQRIVACEEPDDVLSVGLYMVQPWFDVPRLGWTLYQAYLGDTPLAAEEVVRQCWATRRHREIDYVTPEEVVAAARRIAGGPVVFSEGHDATNSGAPGDSTLLLQALTAETIGAGGGLCFCVDPESVEQCLRAGTGAEVDLRIGGKRDPFSQPLAAAARVEASGELRYMLSGHGGHNLPVDMGRMARVRVNDTTVVLVEKTGPGSSPLLYEAAGVDPRPFAIVAAKSPEGFRQDYAPFAAGILYCAAPGCATPFIDEVDFAKVNRPLFPLDEIEDMTAAEWAGPIIRKGAE